MKKNREAERQGNKKRKKTKRNMKKETKQKDKNRKKRTEKTRKANEKSKLGEGKQQNELKEKLKKRCIPVTVSASIFYH